MNDGIPNDGIPGDPFMSSAERMAFLHKTEGDDALITFLQLAIDPHSSPGQQALGAEYDPHWTGTTREALERDADELEALGLPAGAIVREYAARAASSYPTCPFPKGDPGFRNWHLNVRPKDPTPFRTEDDAEQCLANAGYRLDDDDMWRNRFGDIEGMVLSCEGGFRIQRLMAGADWRRYL